MIWSGTLERGRGQLNHEYATFIKIIPAIELPKEVIQKQPPPAAANLKKIENLPELQSESGKQTNDMKGNEELKKYKSEA